MVESFPNLDFADEEFPWCRLGQELYGYSLPSPSPSVHVGKEANANLLIAVDFVSGT